MPSLPWVQAIAAGATFQPLIGWDYEFIKAPGVIRLLHNATAVGLLATVKAGSDVLQDNAPVPAGGTAGVLPSDQVVPAIVDEVMAEDRLKVVYSNPTAGAITVNGQIVYQPA